MRISYQYIFTHSGLFVVAIVAIGCAPEGDLVITGPQPGQPVSPLGPQGPQGPSPAVSGPAVGAPQVDAGADSAEPKTEDNSDTGASLGLLGSAPNPFNPATRLSFSVPEGGAMVTLVVYGVDGRRARQLLGSELAQGDYTVTWRGRDDDGRRLPSGVYFARLSSGGEVRTRKLVMVQ